MRTEPNRPARLIAPHRAAKINARTLDLWGRILARCPESQLTIIGADNGLADNIARYRAAMARHGVGADRIRIQTPVKRSAYFAALGAADLMLDAAPYSGGVTRCDALFSGTPVLTLDWPTIAGGQSAALMRAFGMPAFVADTDDSFVALAQEYLGSDQQTGVRAALRPRMLASSLCAYPQFAATFADTVLSVLPS